MSWVLRKKVLKICECIFVHCRIFNRSISENKGFGVFPVFLVFGCIGNKIHIHPNNQPKVTFDDVAGAEEAKQELKNMLHGKFGEASSRVVIEEHLAGIELSVFVITDGEGYVILPEAKDYKRIGEGDTGLNTGGMGAISPVPFAGEEFLKKVEERVVKPTIRGLKNYDYKGFIFLGLMNKGGDPYVFGRGGEEAAALEAAGIEVHTFSGREICVNGSGGPTCLTRPIYRS